MQIKTVHKALIKIYYTTAHDMVSISILDKHFVAFIDLFHKAYSARFIGYLPNPHRWEGFVLAVAMGFSLLAQEHKRYTGT